MGARRNLLIILFLLGAISFLPAVASQDYWQCEIKQNAELGRDYEYVDGELTPIEGAPCWEGRGRAHGCQIYDESYDKSQGIPEFCEEFCLERSEISEECAEISVIESYYPEKHERRGAALAQQAKGVGQKVKEFFTGSTNEECMERENKEEVGTLVSYEGEVSIYRGLETLPAEKGIALGHGDVIVVSENANAVFNIAGSGEYKLPENTKFQVPVKNEQACKTPSKVTTFFGGLWVKTKRLFTDEPVEIKTPTAVAGVRG